MLYVNNPPKCKTAKTNGRFKLEVSKGNRYNKTALHEYDTKVKRLLRL